MARFNFTNITLQSRADITDIMDNFTKIENLAALTSDLTTAVNTLNNTINSKETALKAVATTSANGMMSSTDKSKLDGIAANANNYSLPTASSTLGGVKTTSTVNSTSGLTACPIIGGVPYYKDTNTTYSNATTSANGLMSKTDKAKLDGIEAGATANTATATTSANGLMSSTDKSKLDGIAANANNYSLPTASSSTLGGVKTSSTVTSNSGYTACPIISGIPYYKNTTYSAATTSANGLMSKTDKAKLDGIETGATATTIENVLTSDSTTNALSAAQGKALNTAISGKAPTSHASSNTTYGVGTASNYGHCKTINNLTTSSHTDGYALSAYQGKVLNDAIAGKQKSISVGTSTPSGGSNGDIYIQYFT